MKSTAMLSAASDSSAGSCTTASASLRRPSARDAAALETPPGLDCLPVASDNTNHSQNHHITRPKAVHLQANYSTSAPPREFSVAQLWYMPVWGLGKSPS